MACEISPAYKLFINDLLAMELKNNEWHFNFGSENSSVVVHQFQIQGTIHKITGLNNEILIVSDRTGKVKVTRTENVPGDFSWLQTGVYCSIIGSLTEAGKLPHVSVIKLAKVDNHILQEMWDLEVSELKSLMTNTVVPSINQSGAPKANSF